MSEGLRILVTGSRDWRDGDAVNRALYNAWWDAGRPTFSAVTVVHGGARGADSIAESLARRHGFQVECHPAAWDTRGRAAGVIRNSEMVNAGADVCLAFIRNQSRGATHCADVAERAGIPTHRLTDDCPCGCPPTAHIGEIGCPCGLPDEPPCAPGARRMSETVKAGMHDYPALFPLLPGHEPDESDLRVLGLTPEDSQWRTCWEFVTTHEMTQPERSAFWHGAHLAHTGFLRAMVAEADAALARHAQEPGDDH